MYPKLTEIVKMDKVALIFLINFFPHANCYTCETPKDWLELTNRISPRDSVNEVISDDFAFANIKKGKKWPGGVVTYKFHNSFTLRDISEARSAFEEYESKTCIKFQPWKEGDNDYVSLEVNETVCGVAEVCRKGRSQFARFGNPPEICRAKATMIHELGHTLCLGHEHERSDRDKYLQFSNCSEIPDKRVSRGWKSTGIYDYSSQFHYECGWCGGGWPISETITKCGSEAGSGLSPLDVDKINELYDCQGCHRHRWRPADSLTDEDKANMYNFGYKLKDGTPLYPCRASFRMEITPGRYDIDTKSCHIGGRTRISVITEGVEVLTIPGGLSNKCSVYTLQDNTEVTRENGIVSSLSFKYTEARGYIAYGSLAINGSTENAIGKVWLRNNTRTFQDSKAELKVGSLTALQGVYKVLTCSLDETCLLQNSCDNSVVSTTEVPLKPEMAKKIVCYMNSLAIDFEGGVKFLPENINPHLCTHLIYFSATVENNVITVANPMIDIKNESGFGHGMLRITDGYKRFNSLKKQNPILKTLIAIDGAYLYVYQTYFTLSDNTSTSRFVENIISFLERHGFDGVDMFWIYQKIKVGNSEVRYKFDALLKEIRVAFDRAGKGYLLSSTVSPNPKSVEFYNVPQLERDLDFVNVHCNDYLRGNLLNLTHHSWPLYRHLVSEYHEQSYYTVNDTVTSWLQAGLPKEKLIMGVPFFGKEFILDSAEEHGLLAPMLSNTESWWAYNEICKLFQEERQQWKISINEHVKAPYAFNGRRWICYEDVESVYHKADYARNMDLGGVSVWGIEDDDFRGTCHNEPYILLKTVTFTLNIPKIPQRPEVVSENE